MNHLNVQLDLEHSELLESLAQKTGRTHNELVAEAIDCAFGESRLAPSAEALASKQRLAIRSLQEKLSRLPLQNRDNDGFSNRDHDQAIYGSQN